MGGISEEIKRMNSEMKLVRGVSRRMNPLKLGAVVVVACLLVPCIFLLILKPTFNPLSMWNLQISVHTSVQFSQIPAVSDDIAVSPPSGAQLRSLSITRKKEEKQNTGLYGTTSNETLTLRREKGENKSMLEIEPISFSGLHGHSEIKMSNNITIMSTEVNPLPRIEEKQRENKSSSDTEIISLNTSTARMKQKADNATTRTEMKMSVSHSGKKKAKDDSSIGSSVPENKVSCDYSQPRSDTCFMEGEIRILGYKSSIILALPSPSESSIKNQTWKIRPYARKWEPPVMQKIKQFYIESSIKSKETPGCTVNHSIPGIIFSTGGSLDNFFHKFTDVLIPLYITCQQYQKEVQFLAANFNSGWINKYQPILNQLSHHKIINLDQDGANVHCFTKLHVGLLSHKELGVDPSKSPNGQSMTDFREMLRTSFSLKRKSVLGSKSKSKRPRLLILQRSGSRSFTNKRDVVGLGRKLGFKVIVASPAVTKNMSSFAQMVNSCDVMMGVHGAGLTNMMFLPNGAVLVQIVPWGGLKWACWNDFGQPAGDMGLRYLEYEIKEEESSLIEQYPRDHAVFMDPVSVQKQGWDVLWSVFLDKQKVKLDVGRFKPVLMEALKSLH